MAGGSVSFSDVTVPATPVVLGTGSIDASGVATFSHTFTAPGTYQIAATYAGTSNFATSTSASVAQVVNKDVTTTLIASNANPSILGNAVTFTATVSSNAPGSGTPTGSVTFKDNGVALPGTQPVALVTGSANFATTVNLTLGLHTITATYSGDANDAVSTSLILNQIVGAATGTVALTASPAGSSVYGQPVTFTATLGTAPGGAGSPTGIVTFVDGTTAIGTGTASTTAGVTTATFATSTLSVATHPVTAVYGGDPNFQPAVSNAVNYVVGQAATTTAIASSNNPSVFGQNITLTATVSATAPGAGTPTGTVTFKDGAAILGTGALNNGVATFATSSLSVNTHSLTAVYGSDTNFAASTSGAVSQVVGQATTAAVLASSANPSVFGQSVTLTATITVTAPGAGSVTGQTVSFMEGATVVGTGTLNASGIATFATSGLSVASHNLTVIYAGNASLAGSTSGTLTQVVNASATNTVVVSSVDPSVVGQNVTFTATVAASAPGAGTPTGSVTFKDGAVTLGSGTLNGSGVATISTAALTLGSHNIVAIYGSDTNFAGSTSLVLNQIVNNANSAIVLASSVNPSKFGQAVTFSATLSAVAPAATGTPSGTITFFDGATGGWNKHTVGRRGDLRDFSLQHRRSCRHCDLPGRSGVHAECFKCGHSDDQSNADLNGAGELG